MRRKSKPADTQEDTLRQDTSLQPEISPELVENIPAEFSEEVPETPGPGGGRDRQPLPTPRTFDLPPFEFFRYWWELRKHDRHKRATVFPYRLWPVTDVLLELLPEEQERVRKLHAAKKRGGPVKNLGLETTLEPFDPNNWEQEIYHRYGAGDYNFKLNDTDPKHKTTVCMCTVRGLRNMDTYPPNCRPTIVVMSDPANKSYIDWARLRGIRFPGDGPSPEQTAATEAEMADEKSSAILAKTIEKLTDKPATPAPTNDAGLVTVFGNMMQGILQQHSAQTDAMVRRMEKMEERLAAPPPALPAPPDPLVQLRVLADVVKGIAPAPAAPAEPKADPMIALLMDMRKQDNERYMAEAVAHREEIKSLREELRAKSVPPPTAAAAGTSELKSLIKGASELKQLFEGLSGGEAPAGPWWVGPVENLVEKLADTATQVTGNLAKMSGVPLPPVPNVAIQGQPPPQLPAVPQPQQQPQQQLTQEQQMQILFDQAAQLIHVPLVQALRQGQPGYEFAGQLLAAYGSDARFMQIYQTLVMGGVGGVLNDGGFLRRNGRAWGEILECVQGQGARIEKFVIEMLDSNKAQQVALAIQRSQAAASQPPVAPQPQQAGPQIVPPPIKPNGSPELPRKNRTIITPDGPVQTGTPDAS